MRRLIIIVLSLCFTSSYAVLPVDPNFVGSSEPIFKELSQDIPITINTTNKASEDTVNLEYITQRVEEKENPLWKILLVVSVLLLLIGMQQSQRKEDHSKNNP